MYSCQSNPLIWCNPAVQAGGAAPGTPWGNTVLFFECPEKAGVVLEAVLEVNMADGLVGQYGVLAGVKPFFQDVLVERDTHVVL